MIRPMLPYMQHTSINMEGNWMGIQSLRPPCFDASFAPPPSSKEKNPKNGIKEQKMSPQKGGGNGKEKTATIS